jgi:hypothetical protein
VQSSESFDDEGDFEAAEAGPTGQRAPAPAPPADRSAGAPARVDKKSRPGLGTVWGETRLSRIHKTSFHRADPDSPFAVARLFYNDRQGVKAMMHHGSLNDHGDSGFSALGGAVTVNLLGADGRALPAFEAASRNYIVGEHGDRYIIQIKNHTSERLEAVATVDGLDVVDGRPGTVSKRGYVVRPFETLRIDGFRQSEQTVAAFRFGSVRDSYASKKGKGRNVGVIGVALFHEQGSDLPWTFEQTQHRHTADPFPDRFAAPPSH